MRKNSPRKWLHACLDLLPVILIPVFMIYSHRHDVTENVQVNYKYQSNEVNSLYDIQMNKLYYMEKMEFADDIDFTAFNDFTIKIVKTSAITPQYWQDEFADLTNIETLNATLYCSNTDNGAGYYTLTLFFDEEREYSYYGVSAYYFVLHDLYFYIDNSLSVTNFKNFYNATKQIYPDEINLPQYTDFNVIESVNTTNSNVMDSFMNKFNSTINTHFNMGNVFNLTGVYQWFNTNIFNGNAPQVIYSVWNIALYELVMDLLFLLYGLFMWFIDMVQHLMDKPFKSIK